MAEAFAKAYGEDILEPYSAGIKPAGFVHSKVITVMEEEGISLKGQTSKPVDPVLLSQMDWVISLSQEAQKIFLSVPSSVHTEYWPVDDPTVVFGKEERILEAFRLTRDTIGERIKKLIQNLGGSVK